MEQEKEANISGITKNSAYQNIETVTRLCKGVLIFD